MRKTFEIRPTKAVCLRGLALLLSLTSATLAQENNVQSNSETDVDPYFRESSGNSSKTGPQSIARNVLQDSKGVFWLATWQGIMRYDGTTFTNVTNKEGLRRYRTFSLLEDHQKNIWLGTVGAGLYRYDGNAYTNFTTKDGLVDNRVLSMMQDSDNNIWFGAMGVTKYDGKTFTSFTKKDGFTSSDVNSISQATDGSIWFGTRGALFRYDGNKFVNFTEKHGLNFPGYIPTLFDRKGHLWFSGANGLYHYDGKKVRHLFQHASYSLMEDSQGNIWFSGGALKGDKNPQSGGSILNRFDPAAGLENILTARKQIKLKGRGMIFGLTEDNDGKIWFGTGRGIGRIDGDTVQYY